MEDMEEEVEFDIGNYRGSLQITKDVDKFCDAETKYYWRVDCDVHYEKWIEIPKKLYDSLFDHYNQPN